MKKVDFWFWYVRGLTGKIIKSPCRLTEEDALRFDPRAVRIGGSCEIRECPETSQELAAAAPSTGRYMEASW